VTNSEIEEIWLWVPKTPAERSRAYSCMHVTCYEGLSENEAADCPIQRALENDFVVVTGTGNAREFIRLLTVELHGKHKEKTDLPDLPIKDPMRLSDCGALP